MVWGFWGLGGGLFLLLWLVVSAHRLPIVHTATPSTKHPQTTHSCALSTALLSQSLPPLSPSHPPPHSQACKAVAHARDLVLSAQPPQSAEALALRQVGAGGRGGVGGCVWVRVVGGCTHTVRVGGRTHVP